MKPCPACTIASNNYLAYARVFAESYREFHPGAAVYVCVVDRPDPRVSYATMPFIPVFAEELGIPAFESFAFRYEILELNTAVKPYFLSYLRDQRGLDKVLYFDPDIQVFSDVSALGALLDDHPVVLTPHITSPLPGSGKPDDRDIVMSGVYNLGFVGFRLGDETAEFLSWWQEKLYTQCLHDIHQGLFVDQRWMDFAPAFLEGAKVARDPVYNVAYWNLTHRRLRQVDGGWNIDGRPLGFFHFSGVDIGNLEPISRYQNRVNLSSRAELRPLFEDYRRRIMAAGHERLWAAPYRYGRVRTDRDPDPHSRAATDSPRGPSRRPLAEPLRDRRVRELFRVVAGAPAVPDGDA